MPCSVPVCLPISISAGFLSPLCIEAACCNLLSTCINSACSLTCHPKGIASMIIASRLSPDQHTTRFGLYCRQLEWLQSQTCRCHCLSAANVDNILSNCCTPDNENTANEKLFAFHGSKMSLSLSLASQTSMLYDINLPAYALHVVHGTMGIAACKPDCISQPSAHSPLNPTLQAQDQCPCTLAAADGTVWLKSRETRC